jgi:hypothetical protein
VRVRSPAGAGRADGHQPRAVPGRLVVEPDAVRLRGGPGKTVPPRPAVGVALVRFKVQAASRPISRGRLGVGRR